MENYEEEINKKLLLTKKTKIICICSFIAMFIIILFIVSPLSNFYIISKIMKMLAAIILGYAIYLNINQSFIIQNINTESKSKEFLNQLNINILCSYIFTLFLIFLFLYTLKSVF
jgi:hypothetical protein